ncbi:hypothetical protein E2C00_17390 [Streptomyces sp. WAC05374]|uniref:hypothetical protein n=1 Tax=Streptomyces sp. WAC05374 TaxID=2487420 RepID=UPI000F8840F7|nr:hypothetical protein [Streptomyces sp. WAC05374]RST16471.1 hypothetical protein EF905_12095 [Streptomyces sp. WAC05374]TDF54683.1 hypothetical protein E2C00_17390 [Streptomyces sp. WAC05374]TDF56319.1 hypothetical protein E2C02_12845 [Streptomyces sp. WAC05374]
MNEIPRSLFQRWWHSFEEDAGGVAVYRSEGYDFPLARGRDGLEFLTDGAFIDYLVGAADAPEPMHGRWRLLESRRLAITFPGTDHPGRELEVLSCDEHLLKTRTTSE